MEIIVHAALLGVAIGFLIGPITAFFGWLTREKKRPYRQITQEDLDALKLIIPMRMPKQDIWYEARTDQIYHRVVVRYMYDEEVFTIAEIADKALADKYAFNKQMIDLIEEWKEGALERHAAGNQRPTT